MQKKNRGMKENISERYFKIDQQIVQHFVN